MILPNACRHAVIAADLLHRAYYATGTAGLCPFRATAARPSTPQAPLTKTSPPDQPEGTGEEFLVGDVFMRLRHRNASSRKRVGSAAIHVKSQGSHRVRVDCHQSHHAPRHVNLAGWERCCAPIVE